MRGSLKILMIVLSIVGISAAFTVPYFFPNQLPSLSASYNYGFNNKLGILILFILCLSLLLISWKSKIYSTDVPKSILLYEFDHTLDKTFRICIIFFVVVWAILWLILRNTLGVGESGYNLPRFYELVLGRKIYTKIDFAYGPLLLYFPLFIYKALSFLNWISVQDAYFISVLCLQIFALYSLYKTLAYINIEPKLKTALYISVYIGMFPIHLGINGFIRFILPFIALYYLRDKKHFIYSLLLFIFTSILVTTSPEAGIAFAFTIIISNITKFFLNRERFLLCNIPIAIIAIVVWPIIMPGMFTQLKSFLSGGFNFPFVPSFAHVMLFSSLCFLAINIGTQLKNIRQNIELLTIELLACSMLPGALGFCEPFHIIAYALFVFILVASFLKNIRMQKLYAVAMIIFALFTLPYTFVVYGKSYGAVILNNHIDMFHSDFGKAIVYGFGKIVNMDEDKIAKRLSEETDNGQVLSTLEYLSDIATPFDVDNDTHIYLIKTDKYHHLPSRNVRTIGSKAAIDQNLAEMKRDMPEYLLLPKKWKEYTEPSLYSKTINLLLITQYSRERKFNGNEMFAETIAFIENHYDFVKALESKNMALQYQLYKLK